MANAKGLIAATLTIGLLAVGVTAANAATPLTVVLGAADPYAILAGTAFVTNTGNSIVTGNLGIHPAAAVTGFPPGIVIGEIHEADAVALAAKNDLVKAYDDAAGRTPAVLISEGTLGGLTLPPGVYTAGGFTLDLTGALILDGQNQANPVWIFQATSTPVTATFSTVSFINGGSACNVFWQVTSSASLKDGSTFVGTILALTSITMTSGVKLTGRALARNGTVTLINDQIDMSSCVAGPVPSDSPTPAPSDSPTPAPSDSPTPAPSPSPTATPTPTASLNATPTPTIPATATPTLPATATPIASATAQRWRRRWRRCRSEICRG